MTITLDSVLTVAIGRNGQAGDPLPDHAWDLFQREVASSLLATGGTIVAHTTGGGLGSDGVNNGQEEESCVFVVINVGDPDRVRRLVAWDLGHFDQSSACFAFDLAHEPVFATPSGFRPASIDDGFGALLAEGHARRVSPR
jgi:hypothetical protein